MFGVELVHSCEVGLGNESGNSNWHHSLLVQSIEGNNIAVGTRVDIEVLELMDWQLQELTVMSMV